MRRDGDMRRWLALVASILAALAAPTLAQAPPDASPNIRGIIAKFDGHVLTIRTPEHATITVTLAPNFMVRSLVRKSLADIRPGDFVGSAAVPGDDGKLHAVEVHFFPADTEIPDRQFPWDLRPGILMTNAHVIGMAKASAGGVLSVDYKNGTAQVIVEPTTPIVAPVPATARDLKRGKAVFIFAPTTTADGIVTANNVTVEKNGVKPSM
jgi:hypothetical protein